MWLGKGFFFCRSNNINLRQKPKNNIVRGCFCRDGEPIFVSAGRSAWLEGAPGRKALTPEATLLDNFCYALHNMEHLTDRPEELKEEIFKRLFKTAEIATFTPEERIKYENDMTTERDIQNYISYAREKGLEEGRAEGIMEGMEKGREEGRIEAARNMLTDEISIDLVAKYTGLSIEQVKQLKL